MDGGPKLSLDFAGVRDRFDLVEVAGRYTVLNRNLNGACPLCNAGRDRFFIRRDRVHWGCRVCERKGDVLDLVAGVENVSLTEAAARLMGQDFHTAKPVVRPDRQLNRAVWKDPAWQRKARQIITSGTQALRAGTDAARYLGQRRIAQATWEAYSVGCTIWCKRPAILIPWLGAGGPATGIKFRFIDRRAATDKSKRFSQMAGSEQIVFGAQLACQGPELLVVVEGEFNAMSVWQASRPRAWAATSLGPEQNSRGLACLSASLARRPPSRIIAWFDRPERALAVANALPDAIPMQSPGGLDANDVLARYGPAVLVELIESISRGQK